MQVLNKDEEEIIIEYILLPLARKTLERDWKMIEESKVKFKEPYIMMIDKVLKELSHDLNEVKREVGKQKMRFKKNADLDYTVFVRGWEFNKRYHPNVAADWVKKRIEIYFNPELKITLLGFKCDHGDCMNKGEYPVENPNGTETFYCEEHFINWLKAKH